MGFEGFGNGLLDLIGIVNIYSVYIRFANEVLDVRVLTGKLETKKFYQK